MNETEMIQRLQNLKNEVDVEMDTAIDNLLASKVYMLQQVDYIIRDLHNEIEEKAVMEAANGI
jgi:hypothetical protein